MSDFGAKKCVLYTRQYGTTVLYKGWPISTVLAGFLGSLPPRRGENHEAITWLATGHMTKMDAVEWDLLSFFKQQVVHKLIEESSCWGFTLTHPGLVKIVVGTLIWGQPPTMCSSSWSGNLQQRSGWVFMVSESAPGCTTVKGGGSGQSVFKPFASPRCPLCDYQSQISCDNGR